MEIKQTRNDWFPSTQNPSTQKDHGGTQSNSMQSHSAPEYSSSEGKAPSERNNHSLVRMGRRLACLFQRRNDERNACLAEACVDETLEELTIQSR
jgi:hypothetical protein